MSQIALEHLLAIMDKYELAEESKTDIQAWFDHFFFEIGTSVTMSETDYVDPRSRHMFMSDLKGRMAQNLFHEVHRRITAEAQQMPGGLVKVKASITVIDQSRGTIPLAPRTPKPQPTAKVGHFIPTEAQGLVVRKD